MTTMEYLVFFMLVTVSFVNTEAGFNPVNLQFTKLRQEEIPTNVMTGEQAILMQELLKQFKFLNVDTGEIFKGLHAASLQSGLSSACMGDVLFLLTELMTNVTSSSALQYIDAASKIPYGILGGKWVWEGDYEECSSILETENTNRKTKFLGKYFSGVIYSHGKPAFLGKYPLIFGYCLPDTCNTTDAQMLLSVLIKKAVTYIRNASKHIPDPELQVVAVFTDKENIYGSGTILTLTISGILITMMVSGTFLDFFGQNKVVKVIPTNATDACLETTERTGLLSGEVHDETVSRRDRVKQYQQIFSGVLRAFSFYSNVKRLLGTTTAHGPLACLNGIRVLSMWWVILGHTYVFVRQFLDNSARTTVLLKRFTFQPILNGTFSVDSFFFLSGLLVAYLAFKEILEKGKLNWVYFFLHRYWRLTPVYAFVILFFIYISPLVFFGPLAFIVTENSEGGIGTGKCKSYWWTNLLYINNFYPDYGSNGCIGWTWYLANDMQFYLFISPVIIILLKRNKVIGLAVSISLIVACVLIRASLVLYYGIPMSNLASPTKHTDDPMAIHGPMYVRPYARMSVYVIGMLTGYLLAVRKTRIRFYRYAAVIGWIVSISVGLAVVYGQFSYNKEAASNPSSVTHGNMVASVFYNSLCRTLFGACLAWVVLACVAGCGGPVNAFLSWTFWAPLGRLTFTAYLVHPIFIFWFYINAVKPLHFSDLNMVYYYIGNLVLSYAIGFLFSMAVEAPMIQLEKILVKGKLHVAIYKRLKQ